MNNPLQEEILTVYISHERPVNYSRALQHAVQEILRAELAKKKHKLGEVRIHVSTPDRLDQAALNFAREVKEAAECAVNERIR